MKKTTVRSIVIGSIALTAVTAGAWFFMFSEPTKQQQARLEPSPPPLSSDIFSKTEQTNQEDLDTPLLESTAPELSTNQKIEPDGTSEIISHYQDNNEDSAEETESTASEGMITEEKGRIVNSVAELNKPDELNDDTDPLRSAENPNNTSTEEQMSGIPKMISFQDGTANEPTDSMKQNEVVQAPEPSCEQVSPILTNFVNSLEKKNYNKEKINAQPLQEHLNALATQLVNNPPVVIHETNDLYTVLTNTAHFFRILGNDNMRLLRKVLKQETADFEDIAAEMYRLSIAEEQCVSGTKRLDIPFTAAYEYAGFFLNTLGGRSYLFRRDPGTRLLVNYYAVLILDQANKKHLNSYGLDISEQLPWLIEEMEANNRLAHRERYLDKLYELAENYQALP